MCVCVQLYDVSAGQTEASLSFSHHTVNYERSGKGHLCLPGLPGDEEEAVIGSVDPVGPSLADHHSTSCVSAAAAASVILKEGQKVWTRETEVLRRETRRSLVPAGVQKLVLDSLQQAKWKEPMRESVISEFSQFNMTPPSRNQRVHLNASLAHSCCGDGSCAFPACRGGHVGERRAGAEGGVSATRGCDGSGRAGLPDATLEETPHWSCINRLHGMYE